MVLDEHRFREITRNKPDLMKAIARQFLSDLPDMLTAIEGAYQAADRQLLADAIHRLKSALGNFVDSHDYQQVSELEVLARAPQQSLSNWHHYWQAQADKLRRLQQELSQIGGQ